jgi:hypothetical protein
LYYVAPKGATYNDGSVGTFLAENKNKTKQESALELPSASYFTVGWGVKK